MKTKQKKANICTDILWILFKAVIYLCALLLSKIAPVAQLDRVLDSGSKGWGFESLQACSKFFKISDLKKGT